MEATLPKLNREDPEKLAEELMRRACDRFGRRDDMTVLAAQVRMPRGNTAATRERHKLVRWRARVESAAPLARREGG
ncbi:MAG: hypothetical protein PHD32_00840 [Eubacteriales bacterium]|nr:hypothetical protein [Eubacteriales bacterium]